MMERRIWKLTEAYGSGFADCWLRSPPEEISEPCKSCTIRTIYKDPVPLVLEWEPGSEKVGDFVWPGGGRIAVTKTAFAELASLVPRLRQGSVEMIQDPKLKKPKRLGRSKPRVWLPYSGPPLVELVVSKSVPVLPSTTTKVTERCDVCGAEQIQVVGIEEKGQRWDPHQLRLRPSHRKRVAGKGIFIARSAVPDRSLFRAEPFPSFVLCTDEVREFVLARQLANIDFLEMGNLI